MTTQNETTTKQSVKRLVSTIVCSILSAGLAVAQPFDKAKMDSFFNRLDEKNKAMGNLLMVKNREVIFNRSIGYARINDTKKLPWSASTQYPIASITKMFTAVIIFQLLEEGKLQLSDKLDRHFPQIQGAGNITIGHLLGHQSGIHNITDNRDFSTWEKYKKSKEEIVAIIAESGSDFEPGTKFSYSNSGYLLLGYIIEKITGTSYKNVVHKRIALKIGLKNTLVSEGYPDTTANGSSSYSYITYWKPDRPSHLGNLGGAGAILSTPADLVQFIQALFNHKLVSANSLHKMMKEKMGIETVSNGSYYLYGHTGTTDGFGSVLFYQPEQKLAMVYSTNGKAYPVPRVIDGIMDIYDHKPFAIPRFESFFSDSMTLEQYVGVYAGDLPFTIAITRNGGTLIAQATGRPAFILEATGSHAFEVTQFDVVLKFDPAKKTMLYKQSGREFLLSKAK